jgi:hypothetical protein
VNGRLDQPERQDRNHSPYYVIEVFVVTAKLQLMSLYAVYGFLSAHWLVGLPTWHPVPLGWQLLAATVFSFGQPVCPARKVLASAPANKATLVQT